MTTTVFDLNDWTCLTATGTDRAAFLHNFCTNDIKGLARGYWREALFCNVKGRILGHGLVLAGADAHTIIGFPGQGERLFSHLDRYILREDVAVRDDSAGRRCWFLSGPDAVEALSRSGLLQGEPVPEIGCLADVPSGLMARLDWFSEPGFLLVDETTEPKSEARFDGEPGTPEEFEFRRIAAGIPRMGVDLNEDNLAQEAARTTTAISFTKGCYLGQEPIARLDALGHTNRELRRLRIEPAEPSALSGSELVTAEGLAAGHLTSTAPAPDNTLLAGLGMIRTKYQTPGTRLVVATTGQTAVVQE
jgi:folate-binding protein YgfZ